VKQLLILTSWCRRRSRLMMLQPTARLCWLQAVYLYLYLSATEK
jgi:hypothetical protein